MAFGVSAHKFVLQVAFVPYVLPGINVFSAKFFWDGYKELKKAIKGEARNAHTEGIQECDEKCSRSRVSGS